MCIVGFNREKIAAAIRKAMLTTEAGEDEVLVYKIVDRIEFRGKEQSSAIARGIIIHNPGTKMEGKQ